MKFRWAIVAVAMLVAAFAAAVPAQAAEYVKVCSPFHEPAWEYIPGTNTCINVLTGETRTPVWDGNIFVGSIDGTSPIQQGIVDAQAKADRALDGVAIGLAMQPAIVTPGHSFAISANVGAFAGKVALGLGAAMAVNDNVQFHAAVGGSASGAMAARAGINISW